MNNRDTRKGNGIRVDLIVVGGGLAGCEAAWQAAQRGLSVVLYEMRPERMTGAHMGGLLAELVCSNSMGAKTVDRASGLLKEELRRMGSLLLACAESTAVSAGNALAVDRNGFAQEVTKSIESHPRIVVRREEVQQIPDGPCIIASGPLTSVSLSTALKQYLGEEHLFFFDAVAPIVELESIDFSIAYRGSRYGKGDQPEGDYVNCPMNQVEYEKFVEALIAAERIDLKEFEADLETGVTAGPQEYFEGCLPIEIMARRGKTALAFGPMRPVGLRNPHTGSRAYAVVQLRQDNLAATLYNLVGFQTNLTYAEQKKVFRMIPGLQNAEFMRFGQMHRNTYIYSPEHLDVTLQAKKRRELLFAGQITGVEGYLGNIATGLLAGINASRLRIGLDPLELPRETMLGALCHYITSATRKDFQPMKANMGILPKLGGERVYGKRERGKKYSERALRVLEDYQRGIIGE
jgi:methylenetetrahydrofolate--tRNA-(uracil-5-)-methyltransferase